MDKQTALYAVWLCLRSEQAVDADLRKQVLAALGPEYPSRLLDAYGVNRLLSEILVMLEADDVVQKTIRLLNASSSQTEQMHYLYVLRQVREGWTIDDRRDYFAGLSRATHYLGGAGMSDFLRRIREEAVATLDDRERAELGALMDEQQAADPWVDLPTRPLVRKWTVDDLTDALSTAAEADASRGAKIFAAAACIRCHRFGAQGTLIGPDLTSASRRFSRRDLLMSIIEPSRVIAENYRSLQVLTADGKTYVGQATLGGDYRSPILRLAPDPSQPFKTIEIPKTEIEAQQESTVSWMPEGLLDTFTSAEISDLLAYLESSP
jgi:putative heme-binding domain-containing protein